jgi:hypothetical protein
MQGDEKSAQLLSEINQQLLNETEVGKVLLDQSKETQEALKKLQEAGKNGLTREILLETLTGLKSDNSLTTVVSLTRNGLDYQFFQLLSEKIDQSSPEQKQPLVELRDKLLNLTREIDNEMKKRLEDGMKLLDTILAEDDLESAVKKHLPEMDEFFSQGCRPPLKTHIKKVTWPGWRRSKKSFQSSKRKARRHLKSHSFKNFWKLQMMTRGKNC